MLHAVEDGLVTLIGATTENPYFEVNQALLSRCTVIELQPLTVEELGLVLERGAAELGADVAGDVCEAIAGRSGGDAQDGAPDPRARLGDGDRLGPASLRRPRGGCRA